MEVELSMKPQSSQELTGNQGIYDQPQISGDSFSTTSASDTCDTDTCDDESDSDDGEREGSSSKNGKDKKKPPTINDADDLLLHSLDTERFGPFVQKFFSKYLANNEEKDFLNKTKPSSSKEKEESNNTVGSSVRPIIHGGRTIKAATRHIDEQGKKAASVRQHSQSMINLSTLDSPPGTPAKSEQQSGKNGESESQQSTNLPKITGIRSIIESQYEYQQETCFSSKLQDPKKKKKRQHKIRVQEKCAMLPEEENESSTNDGVPVERKSQFSCLPSRPIYRSSIRSNGISSSNSLRSYILGAPDCPVDRIQFYRSFSQLLRKGKRDVNNSFMSNKDANMGGFIELVYMQELRDLIWLELKAWFENRSMIEEDAHLCLQRQKIPSIIEKIRRFTINPQRSRSNSLFTITSIGEDTVVNSPTLHSNDPPKWSAATESTVDASKNENGNCEVNDLRVLIDQDKLAASVAMKLNMGDNPPAQHGSPSPEVSSTPNQDDENCNCSETLSRLCKSCVDKETHALKQVNEVLEELYEMEHLYPCTKTLAYDFPAYATEAFTARVKSMNLFVNITRDMRQKIDMLAKLFLITNREAVGWPVFDEMTVSNDNLESCEATPEIRTQDFSGYSYRLHAQVPLNSRIHFKHGKQSNLPEDCNSSTNSDLTLSDSNSPEIHPRETNPFDSSISSKGSGSGHSGHSGNTNLYNNPAVNPFFHGRFQPSIYRRYVDKALRNKGLRYIYHQLSHILRPLLYKVHAALKKPSSYTYGETVSNSNSKLTVSSDTTLGTKKLSPISTEYCDQLSQFGVWSLAYQQMFLPTFHRPFLFLLRVTVDVVHECLRLRLEQQPEKPSAVSVAQLIRECKEVLRAGVQIRQSYVNLAQTVLGEGGSDVIEAQLDSFDDDLKTMLQIYLQYLDQWIYFMQQVSTRDCSTLRQKGHLEEEWTFVRTFCPHIPGGEALAANQFCRMASNLLVSIGDYIEKGIDECFVTFDESIKSGEAGNYSQSTALESFRKFKGVFQEARAPVCQAAAFAKTLRKDLEIAAEFQLLVDDEAFLSKLQETGHIRVIAPHNLNHLIFVPSYMQGNEGCIWQLVDMTCGGRTAEDSDADTYGYLVVMLKKGNCDIDWKGTIVVLEPTAEANISLSHVEVDNVLFVVNNPSQLPVQYRQFESLMTGYLKIDKPQTSCNNTICEALTKLKQVALLIANKTSRVLNLMLSRLDISRIKGLEEREKKTLQITCLDVLHQGFKLGFEYKKALTRLMTGNSRNQLALQLIDFGLQWIKFILEKCEKGRGLRTRWVTPGLQYLLVALEPQYLQLLNDEQYVQLKHEVDKFLTHLTGSNERSPKVLVAPIPKPNIQGPYSVLSAASNKPLASSLNFQRSQSVVNIKGMFGDRALAMLDKNEPSKSIIGTRLEEWAKHKFSNGMGCYIKSQRPKKPIEDNSSYSESKSLDRIQKALERLDQNRDNRLREENVIGSVSDVIIQRTPLQINARRVNFPWQRGCKIGEGRFGKVYTAVNNATGELIAMKEIRLQPNDHRAIKELIDEIRIFEGIKHPNLVRYFGVEIHREEMYIFMEYCNGGSLENAVLSPLPEQLVRKYTRKLLEAVNVLHENGIVHRDIKSANIFLKSDGNLKLGDFGCCMKLKNHTTLPGELNTFVGTPAYMAPEIFTRNSVEGHGRASDIWSVGCVVLEMLTGRRPWHDLDNSYQIMFRVGMGETPEVPESICEEGKQFIHHCLQHDPRDRLSSSQLLCHPFTKVVDDDD